MCFPVSNFFRLSEVRSEIRLIVNQPSIFKFFYVQMVHILSLSAASEIPLDAGQP